MKVLIHSNVSWDLNILTSVYENDLFCAINIKAWNYIYWAITLKCTPSTLPTTYSSFDLSLYIPLDSSILYRVSISRLTQIHARKQSPNVFHIRGSNRSLNFRPNVFHFISTFISFLDSRESIGSPYCGLYPCATLSSVFYVY